MQSWQEVCQPFGFASIADKMTLRTLADNCLVTIAQNLDYFLLVYNHAEDGAKERIWFLQRYYADKLMSEALLQGDVKKEYFPLLLSKHLQKLDLQLLNKRAGKKKKNSLEDDVSDFPDTNYSLRGYILSNLSNLRILLARCICFDGLITTIASCCPLLEVLDISESPKVSDQGILQLCRKGENGKVGNPLLRDLTGRGILLRAETINLLLENLPSLEYIAFGNYNCQYALARIFYIYRMADIFQGRSLRKYNLKKLNASRFEYPESLRVLRLFAELCPNVTDLSVNVDGQGILNECFKFTKLRYFSLRRVPRHEDLDVNIFLNMKISNLTRLRLDSVSFSLDDLAMSCPSLRSLHLVDPLFQRLKHDCIPKFRKLEKINLDSVDLLQKYAIKSMSLLFSSCANLNHLRFLKVQPFNQDLSSEIIKTCSLNPVQIISLRATNVDYSFLKQLLEVCKILRILRVDESNLDRKDLPLLESFSATLRNRPKLYCEFE